MIAAKVVTLHDHTTKYILEGQKFVSKVLVYFLRMLPSLSEPGCKLSVYVVAKPYTQNITTFVLNYTIVH